MQIHLKKVFLNCLVASAFGLAMSGTALAQERPRQGGVRAGISASPDQVYFGAHLDVAEVAKGFWFRPNIEVGFGDGSALGALNAEFLYHFPAISRVWRPYLGAGPAMVIAHSGVGPGFNFVFGIEKQKGLLAEIKAGLLDSPEFKLGIGWNL